MTVFKAFGKNPAGKRLERIHQSPNFRSNHFQNLSATPMMSSDSSYLKMTRDFISKPKSTAPSVTLPFVKTDLKNLRSDQPVIVWFGHSSYLVRINERNILVDPVFSGNASPFSFMIKAFAGANEYRVEDFPEIDLLILTHDHYDHLDYKTFKKLGPKVKKIFCSLGVGSHLEWWGTDTSMITEFDWWDSHVFENGIELTATPARHFSGRGLTRGKTLWSSFVLKTDGYSLFLGGDSGYDSHFKMIGEKFGPFDLAILEAGQYNTSWPLIHMMPEETVQACIDLNAKLLLPVHWGKFSLALHDWNEPIKRVLKKANELGVKVTTPLIGELFIPGEHYPRSQWWDLR